jgi:hypothetical protein
MSPDEDEKPLTQQGPVTQEQQREELEKVAENAQDVLIKAQSIFPFVLFPDTIAVSRMKVTITRRMFFRTTDVISLQHEDILNIEVDTGPFFGSLNIFTRIYGTDPLRITFLSRKSAVDVKRIIEGALIAHQQNINTQELEKGELIALLTKLGSDAAMS